MAMISTEMQINMIKNMFGEFCQEQRTSFQQREGTPISTRVLIDPRFKDVEELDKAVYQPPGGHWSFSCVAYNQYVVETQPS